MKILWLAVLIASPAFAQLSTNQVTTNDAPIDPVAAATLVTSQKLIVRSANAKKFCGYLANDAQKSTVCFPEDVTLKDGQLNHALPAGSPVQVTIGNWAECKWNDKGSSCTDESQSGILASLPVFNSLISIALPNDGYNNGACAIDRQADGTSKVICWGPTKELLAVPLTITKPTLLATNGQNSCADSTDGHINCWGADDGFADAPKHTRRLSKLVMNSTRACSIDAYGLSCWGPQSDTSPKVPEDLLTDGAVLDVALGRSKGCALTFKHQVVCWGPNSANVPDLKNPIALAAYSDVVCATDDDGVKCWGSSYLQVPGKQTPSSPYDTDISSGSVLP